MGRVIRTLAYAWASPYTLLGVSAGLLLGGRFRRVSGVIEIHGPAIARVLSTFPVPAAAMTLGHVVLGRTPEALAATRLHERVHVRQYERWGVLFLPAYCLASALLFLRRKDAYRDNPFEKEAYGTEDACRSLGNPPGSMPS